MPTDNYQVNGSNLYDANEFYTDIGPLNTTVSVNNSSGADFDGPTIISFSVSPTNVNLSSENVTVVATLQASM